MHDCRRPLSLALPLLVVAWGCNFVTDFDRFHEREDGGSARDATTVDGARDAGECTDPVPEECNGEDDDCDGAIDEEWECPDVDHGAPSCTAGACATVCDDGFADCDGEYDNGCEVDLTSPDHCGACGESCDAESFCSADGCVSECPDGTAACGRSCIDTSSSVLHCGACDSVCPAPAHGAPTCASGSCGMECDDGWEDCDGDAANGCETALGTVTDCGGCGDVCSYANGAPACTGGVCELTECNDGFDDCNSDDSDGCEADLATVATCGACGTTCAAPDRAAAVCGATGCTYTCDAGWQDCNGLASDGCEASLADPSTCGDCDTACTSGAPVCSAGSCTTGCSGSTPDLCGGSCVDVDSDPLHCGGCGTACTDPPHAMPTCSSATCGFACDTGYADCNSNGSDGCETDIHTVSDCGSCGVPCTRAHATPTCSGGTCRISSCTTPWADCNSVDSDGCEADLTSVGHCGSCGNTCIVAHGTPRCSGGECVIESCDDDRGDCDGDYANGCEATLQTYYRDVDGDGYGITSSTMLLCPGITVSGWATTPGDCDDSNDAINPRADEVCNRLDDDCDGYVDENVLGAASGFPIHSGTSPRNVRVAWSPALGQAAAIFSDHDAGGTHRLYLVRARPDGTILGSTTLDSGAAYYQADVTATAGGWAVVFARNGSGAGPNYGRFGYVGATGTVSWGSFPPAESDSRGPELPRIAYAEGSDTVMVAWMEDGATESESSDYIRVASYDGLSMISALRVDQHAARDFSGPAITFLTGREFAIVWGSFDATAAGYTRYRRVEAAGTVSPIYNLHTDTVAERDHEIVFAGTANQVIISFFDAPPPPASPTVHWSHGRPSDGAGTGKLTLPSAVRALPGWAGDGAYSIAFGAPDAAGGLRRFRPSDDTVVPGDVSLAAGQVVDMDSMRSGAFRHVLGFPRSDEVRLRFIGCL